MLQDPDLLTFDAQPLSPAKPVESTITTTAFTEAQTQTDPVRILYPDDPHYYLIPSTDQQTESEPQPSKPSKPTKTPKQPAKPKTQKKPPTKKVKAEADSIIEYCFASDDDLLNEDVMIDVEGEESGESEFEVVKPKGRGKGKAATVKAGAAKKGKAATTAKKRGRDDGESGQKGKKKKGTATTTKKSAAKGKQPKHTPIDPFEMHQLSLSNPDTYWINLPGPDTDPHTMINQINTTHPLTLKSADIRDAGHITGMIISPDGRMLVTFCTMGSAKIWDCETWSLVQVLRDEEEPNIDEFYVGRFLGEGRRLVVGGKLKDPKKWSEEDDDNHILPCPLKVFDVVEGKVVERLEGHEEEILCIKDVRFKGENYFVTTSQDGYIITWKMGEDWSGLQEYKRMEDGETCMAFNVSFLPNCGNKYFIAACDSGINIFDLETSQKLQTFPNLYTCYCDCAKFVYCLDYPEPPSTWDDAFANDEDMFAYFITRGVEEVEVVEGEHMGINTIPNTARLHKLVYPNTKGGEFKLEEVRRYQHDDYRSNSWLTKVTSNGRYILAPTYDGAVVIFNMKTGEVTGILRDHEAVEVRDVVFGWRGKWIASCGDDGAVKVYVQDVKEEDVEEEGEGSSSLMNE